MSKTGIKYTPSTAMVRCRDGAFRFLPVIQTIAHPPGSHPKSPIRNELYAVELKTAEGSSWRGFDYAWINSELRMCVKGFSPNDELIAKWEDCHVEK